jgi:hypothetical protein
LSSELRQVGGFLQVSSTNKADCHDITEILLKVALNTITLTGWWFSPGTPVSSTNKADCYDITNIVESGVKHHNSNPNP